MEQVFLNRSTKPKTKKKDIGDLSSKATSLLTCLAKKVRNMERKMLGKDGKPIKPYRQVKAVENPIVVEAMDAYRAEDGVAGQVVAASNQNELNDGVRETEQGFLNRSTKPKTKKKDIRDSSSKAAPLLIDLAKKVRNIEGKMLGKDSKPIKPYRQVKAIENPIVVEAMDADRAEDGVAGQVVAARNQNELNDVLPTSCVVINIPDVTSVSKTNEGTVVTPVSTLMNEEKVLGAHVALPLAAVQEISAKFDHTLYGYFIGPSLAFSIVNNYVRNAWSKYRLESTVVGDGFFLFKFSSHEGRIKVLVKGPWFIRSTPLMLNTWSPNTKMKKEYCLRISVWTKIHKVPMVAFSEVGLSLITTQLGRPLMLDACTMEMCLNPWGPKTYARVLIELSVDQALMNFVIVVVPFPSGTGHSLENLDVEY
ncbi:zinc knuckle CX2CX4HX4C containing protein [Tanacetum coccineum]